MTRSAEDLVRTRLRASLDRQQPDSVRFQDGASEAPGHECPGINVDPIGENLWASGRAVPVHHNFPEINIAREKFIADPQQVILMLLRERDAWAHTGMAQKITADCQRGFKRAEKLSVGLRQHRAKGCCGRVVSPTSHQRAHVYAVRVQRLKATEAAPVVRNRWINKKSFEDGFMVALQRRERSRKGIAGEPFYDPLRVRAAVNIIAQCHSEAIGDRSDFQIACDAYNHTVEEIRSAVEIADNVNAGGRRGYCRHQRRRVIEQDMRRL
jgi:hypothetical protein